MVITLMEKDWTRKEESELEQTGCNLNGWSWKPHGLKSCLSQEGKWVEALGPSGVETGRKEALRWDCAKGQWGGQHGGNVEMESCRNWSPRRIGHLMRGLASHCKTPVFVESGMQNPKVLSRGVTWCDFHSNGVLLLTRFMTDWKGQGQKQGEQHFRHS